MSNTQEAIKNLEDFEAFYHTGDTGKFLHPRKDEFYEDKKEDENMLEWFIRKAKEALLEARPEPTEFTENIRTIIATAIQCGRSTGYIPTENEWYEIKKACDIIDRQVDSCKLFEVMIGDLQALLKAKDIIIDRLNNRLSDIGGQC